MPAQTLITHRIQAPQVKYKNGDVGIYVFSIIVKPIKMINNTKPIKTLASDVANLVTIVKAKISIPIEISHLQRIFLIKSHLKIGPTARALTIEANQHPISMKIFL